MIKLILADIVSAVSQYYLGKNEEVLVSNKINN